MVQYWIVHFLLCYVCKFWLLVYFNLVGTFKVRRIMPTTSTKCFKLKMFLKKQINFNFIETNITTYVSRFIDLALFLYFFHLCVFVCILKLITK